MFKKILSFMLAVMMIMSVVAISASAAQVEIADNAADAAADTGADAGADTAAGNKIYFEPDTAGWNNYKKVFCHIWAYGGDSFFPWQGKKEGCVDNKDGKWYYDLDAKGVTLAPGTLYACIFSNENGMQTYNLLMDSTCIGDTAYCDGTTYENPEDSSKTALAAFWRGKDPAVFGPEMCVTSIGNIVGTCIPSTTSAYSMFVDFLANKLTNAQTYSGKDDQTLLDDTAKALGLGQDDIEAAIKETGVTVKWTKTESKAEEGSNEEAKQPGKKPTTGGGNGGGNGGSNGGGSTGGGSGSGTQTGQSETMIYIMLGLMAIAGVAIVVARKRENA